MFHGQPVPCDRVYGLTFGRGVSRNLAVRMSAEQDPQGGSWAAREAAGIGQRVARRRATARLSAQQVADRCADLGMPGLTRQVLARLEHGRRESVSTAELAVIAAALETAPVLLLYPVGLAETVEFLPGKDGLVHISELANFRVKRTEDIVKEGDDITVKCLGVDEKGRVRLSRKAAMEERDQEMAEQPAEQPK